MISRTAARRTLSLGLTLAMAAIAVLPQAPNAAAQIPNPVRPDPIRVVATPTPSPTSTPTVGVPVIQTTPGLVVVTPNVVVGPGLVATPGVSGPTTLTPCLVGGSVVPEIFASEVSAPDPSTLLDRAPIFYLSGTRLSVALTVPRCTDVIGVKARGENVPEASTVFEPAISYEIVSDEALPDDRHRVTLRLRFDNDGLGDSYPMQVMVGSPPVGGRTSSTAEFGFTLVLVKTVGGPMLITVARGDLQNSFIREIWRTYGADDRLTDADGNTTYDPGYGSVFAIANDGIRFNWRVKVDVEDWCDRQASVSGRFTLQVTNGQVQVNWVDGPDVEVSIPSSGFFGTLASGGCSLAENTVFLVGITVKALARSKAEAAVRTQIEEAMSAHLPSGLTITIDSGFGPVTINLLESATFQTLPGEVRVSIGPPAALLAPHVAVDVPYHGLRTANPMDRGFALKAGDDVRIMASGLAAACFSTRFLLWPDCLGQRSTGPVGLFNTEANLGDPGAVPILDPTQADRGLTGPRVDAYNAMELLQRTPSELPFSDANVGALVARSATSASSSQLIRIGGGPVAPTFSQRTWLSFGANDRVSGTITPYAYGSGTFQVTVAWLN